MGFLRLARVHLLVDLPLVSGAIALVGHAVALIGRSVSIVSDAIALVGSAVSVVRLLLPLLCPICGPTLPVALRCFAQVRLLVPFIRSAAPHLQLDLALVGRAIALVGGPIALGHFLLIVLAASHSFMTIPRRRRAR